MCCVLQSHHKDAFPQLPGASSGACSSLAVSGDARLLLTAACQAIKVWDYSMQAGPACQVCAMGGWAGERTAPPGCPVSAGLTPQRGLGPPGQTCVLGDGSASASGVSVRGACCPQVYIGHSEPVQALASTPNQQQLLSAGDAVFFWDILAPLRGRPQKGK